MSDRFTAILGPRRHLSEEDIIAQVERGELDRALTRLNCGQATEAIKEAIVAHLADHQRSPALIAGRVTANPFSDYFLAERESGLIHHSQGPIEGDLLCRGEVACRPGEVEAFCRVMPGRFIQPANHQSRCPSCDNPVSLKIATAEVVDTGSFARLLRSHLNSELNRLLNEGEIITPQILIETASPRACAAYQAEAMMAGGREALTGLIGADDYQYFAEQFSCPPEEVVDYQDWLEIMSDSSLLRIGQSVIYLLMERMNA